MKILYYFKEQDTPMYQWQRFHIFRDLSKHGCEIIVFNPLKYPTIDIANACLIDNLKSVHYDLFMTPHNESDLYIDILLDIKKTSIPTLLICFDNLTIPHSHKKICKYFDLVWLTSKETKYLFDKWKANSICLPYAANPDLCISKNNIDIPKIVFIGTPYGSRAKMINTLLANHIPITLYANIAISTNNQNIKHTNYKDLINSGLNMLHYPIGRKLLYASIKNKIFRQSVLSLKDEYLEIHPAIPLQLMMETYSQYAMALSSVANRHTGILKHPVNIVNLRSFEIPAAGGLQFCSFHFELAEYFESGKEAIYYTNEQDMLEKACFYLSPRQASLRQKMKLAARRRAENEHTWFCRFQKVFDNLGLKYDK